MPNLLNKLMGLGETLDDLPKIEYLKIPGGVRGNMKTLQYMIIQARRYSGLPIVREFALWILNSKGTVSHRHRDEALAVGEYIQKGIEYAKDPVHIEYLQSPVKLIKDIRAGKARGDCDDMALLAATVLLSIGIQPYFKVVKYNPMSSGFNHIYVTTKEKNGRDTKAEELVIDCIVKDRPIGYEVSHHKESARMYKVI